MRKAEGVWRVDRFDLETILLFSVSPHSHSLRRLPYRPYALGLTSRLHSLAWETGNGESRRRFSQLA